MTGLVKPQMKGVSSGTLSTAPLSTTVKWFPGEFYFSALHWLSNWPFLAKVPPTSQGMQGCTSENVGGELSQGPDPGSGTRSFLKEGAF